VSLMNGVVPLAAFIVFGTQHVGRSLVSMCRG
jgi:hypothetical protein